jgi:hypothetical protein
MTIETVENRFLWIKKRERILFEKQFKIKSLENPNFERYIKVVSADSVYVSDSFLGSVEVKSLSQEEINKANLVIARKGKKEIKLRWRK